MLQPNMVRLQNPNPCFYYGNHFSFGNSIITAPFTPRIHSISTVTGRNTKSAKLVVKSRQADYYEQQEQRFSSSPNHNHNSGGQVSPKVFLDHCIHKSKAALSMFPRPPEFTALDSGAFKVSTDGKMRLQFAPASSDRQYDFSRKQLFTLSVAEMGTLISLGATGSCEFFHDPNWGKSDKGKVWKVLKVEPLPDGSGHLFNLIVQNKIKNVDENICIPVTRAEYAILVAIFNYSLPYLLGWNVFAYSIKPNDAGHANASNSSGQVSPKVFVGHYIYKGKAALAVDPQVPEFALLNSGAFKVSTDGKMLLQFAPTSSDRQYDLSRKQFSLSVAEMGTLISLGATGSCEFFHDPKWGKSDKGKVLKVLKVEPLPDGSGHLFNLSVRNKIKNVEENICIPVTRAEYTVLVAIFNYILPYLLGWNVFANSIKPGDTGHANASNSWYGWDSGWKRNSIITAPFTPRIHSISPVTGRNTKNAKVVVKSRQPDYYEQQEQRFSSAPNHNHNSGRQMPPKVFVGYNIYKGKVVLKVIPVAPKFATLDSGAFKVSNDGYIMLEFTPATGDRHYDWTRKQLFSLSVAEMGTLISLGAMGSCELFRDPNRGRSDEGKVRKVLKVEPLPDGSGHLFNLSVQNKISNMEENIYIPVTRADYAVLVAIFNYILPYLLGWNVLANSTKPGDAG